MFDFTKAYNSFKSLEKAEKFKKIKWLLENLKGKLTTYDDMYNYINDKSDSDIEDQSLINYYELILNDLIKMEELASKKGYKNEFKKLLMDMNTEKIEESDQKQVDNILKNI